MPRRRISAPAQWAADSNRNAGVPFRPPHIRSEGIGPRALDQPSSGRVQILNAFTSDYAHLTLVLPGGPPASGGRRRQRVPAEHSCFLSMADVTDKMLRMLKRHAHVRWVKKEGDWLRICWMTREISKDYCRKFHKNGIQTYEGNINPVLRYMVDHPMEIATPRRLWVDLETDSRVPFRLKEEGRTLSWATVTADGHEEYSCLRSDTDKAERDLYGELWEVLNPFDQIIAWNGNGFDFPVIRARSIVHRLIRSDNEWLEHLWLDQMALFMKMNMAAAESGDEKQSMKLGDVGAALGVGTKDDFDASKTWEAWVAGGSERRRLVDYMRQDVRLMPLIERETGFIEILQTLSQTCGTLPDSRGINPSVFVEGYMQQLALTEGQKIPTVLRMKKGDKYKGAFVMEPKGKGIIKNVHVADFSALYPTIIRTWNMSPETIIKDDDGRPLTREEVVMDSGEDIPDGVSHSPLTDVYFDVDSPALLAKAVGAMMGLRKEWTVKKNAEPPGTDAWKDADRRSSAFKIAANSFYGVIGLPTSRFFDRSVAEAVTQCGAWLILETIRVAEERGMEVIYADTDSLFVRGATKAEFEVFVEWCNTEFYPEILKTVGCKENHINLAYEKEFERIIMPVAKKYCGSYVHYKGAAATEDSKPEIKGLEYKRGDSIRLTRRLQEEAVYMLVGYKCEPSEDPADFERLLDTWVDRILKEPLALEEVVISKRLGRPLEGYVRKKKLDGDYARQPPHVEMARVLEARGRDVSEGTKIEYVIIDGTTKPATIIPGEDWDGTVDTYAIWDSQVAAPTIRLLAAAFPDHDWSKWKRIRPPTPRKPRKKKDKPAGQTTEAGDME